MAKDASAPPPRRADARRNIEAILAAAAKRLSRDPDASIAQIAQDAGVGRITLYGHFSSRAELIDAVIARAIADGEGVLEAVDLTGDARDALVRLTGSSWQQIVGLGALMQVAASTLTPERMLELHDQPAPRVETLIERGRDEGVFRTDLPTSWLVGTLHRVMNGAAAEIDADRLAAADAAATIAATVLAAFTAPGQPVPSVRDVRRP